MGDPFFFFLFFFSSKLKQSIFNPAEGLRNLKAFKVLVKHLFRAPIYKQ